MKTSKPISWSLTLCVLFLMASALTREATPDSSEVTQWEYSIVDVGELIIDERLTEAEILEAEKRGIEKARNLEDKFNRMGADGWEVAVYTRSTIVFKRPTQ